MVKGIPSAAAMVSLVDPGSWSLRAASVQLEVQVRSQSFGFC